MTAMPELTTERLVVRPFGPADLDAFLGVFGLDANDTAALANARRFLVWSELNGAVLAELHQPPYGDRAVVLRATGEVVGAVGLVPCLAPFDRIPGLGAGESTGAFTPEVGLFWATAPAHRGRGLATEAARAVAAYAFAALHLRRLVATTDGANLPSVAVMRRLGMRIERNPEPEPAWFQVVGVLEPRDPLPPTG